MRHRTFFVLLLGCAGGASAQGGTSAQVLRDDFRYLVTALEQTHPDPYTAFGSRLGFHRTAREYQDRISDGMTLTEFRELVGRFMAVLEDGHTGLNTPPAPDVDRRRILPLRFAVATDGLFVSRATDEHQHLVGARLLRVASLPLDSVLKRVRRLTPSENRYGTYRDLQQLLRYDDTARRVLPDLDESLAFTLQSPENDTLAVEIPFRDTVDLVPQRTRARFSADNGLLYWDMIGEEEDVAYFAWHGIVSREVAEADLRRGNLGAVRGELNWIYRFLRNTPRSGTIVEDIQKAPGLYGRFRAMLEQMRAQDAQYLILDLRRNGGGMTPLVRPLFYMLYGDEFLAHDFRAEYDVRFSPLLLAKWGVDNIEQYNESNGTNFRLGDYRFSFFWPSDSSKSITERRALDNITYFSRVGAEYVEDLEGTPIYTPRIIVLTSPDTFSAAYHFMYFLWEMGGTTVVGVPSRQAGNAFMEVTPFTLPRTGIEGSISNAVQVFFPDDPERGQVFMPDFPMSWRDYAAYDFDPHAEILYALDLIEAGRIAGFR